MYDINWRKLREKAAFEDPLSLTKKEAAELMAVIRQHQSSMTDETREKLQKLQIKYKLEDQMKEVEKLGFNYVYHYNEFEKKWYCIHRDSYLNYWSKNMESANWTKGDTVEEAAAAMVKKEKL